jgi:hypothetical protein
VAIVKIGNNIKIYVNGVAVINYTQGFANGFSGFTDNRFNIGIGGDSDRVFNGAGCLAAQLVAEMKEGAGNIYIYPINASGCGEVYEYHIIVDFDTKEVTLKCFEVWNKKKLLFEGKPADFEQFVTKLAEKE